MSSKPGFCSGHGEVYYDYYYAKRDTQNITDTMLLNMLNNNFLKSILKKFK